MDTPSAPQEPDAITRLRLGLPVGEAGLMPVHKLGPPVRTSWVLRRADAHIARSHRHPDCRIEQRGVSWRFRFPSGTEVHLVAVAIGMGVLPYGPDDIFAAFINEHEPVVQGLLENLTTQSMVPIQIIGDPPEFDCLVGTDNTLRAFAQKVLARISAMPRLDIRGFQARGGDSLSNAIQRRSRSGSGSGHRQREPPPSTTRRASVLLGAPVSDSCVAASSPCRSPIRASRTAGQKSATSKGSAGFGVRKKVVRPQGGAIPGAMRRRSRETISVPVHDVCGGKSSCWETLEEISNSIDVAFDLGLIVSVVVAVSGIVP